jgi:hypothetical protein
MAEEEKIGTLLLVTDSDLPHGSRITTKQNWRQEKWRPVQIKFTHDISRFILFVETIASNTRNNCIFPLDLVKLLELCVLFVFWLSADDKINYCEG